MGPTVKYRKVIDYYYAGESVSYDQALKRMVISGLVICLIAVLEDMCSMQS